MKNLLLASVCFLPLALFGQNLPSAYLKYIWQEDLFDWQLEREERYLYDENDSLIQKSIILPGDPRALDRVAFRLIYQYNQDGSERSYLQQNREGNDSIWVNKTRQNWFTDDEGYYGWLRENWEEGGWVPYRHYRYKTTPKDSFLILDNYLDYFREGQWEPAYHDSSHLNLAGNEIEKWSSAWDWDGQDWLMITHWETDYSQYGDVIRQRQDNLAQNPPNYIEQRWLIDYDSRGDIWSKTYERRTTNKPEWKDLGTDKYRYDAERRKTIEERTYVSPTYWRNQFRREFEYREDTTLERFYSFKNGQGWQAQTQTWTVFSAQFPSHKSYQRIDSFRHGNWEKHESKSYQITADEAGQLHEITLTHQSQQQTANLGVLRIFQTYDDFGRVLSSANHYFDSRLGDYIPINKRVWVYNDALSAEAEANHFVIYPQPVSKQINLQFLQQQSTPKEIQIFDLNGKMLLVKKLEALPLGLKLQLNRPIQTSGLYFLRVIYEDGSSRTQKLQLI